MPNRWRSTWSRCSISMIRPRSPTSKLWCTAWRFAFKAEGLDYKRFTLPSIKHEKKLPVILSQEEMRRLLRGPWPAWAPAAHWITLWLRPAVYGGAQHPHQDLDLDRRLLHVRKGKGRKDMCPWASCSAGRKGATWKRRTPDVPVQRQARGPQRVVTLTAAIPNAGAVGRTAGCLWRRVSKRHLGTHPAPHLCPHLLEDGLDIVSIKELLGHERIETTMVYLHRGKASAAKRPSVRWIHFRSPHGEAGLRRSAGHTANMGTG